jgi:hypothetical protein
VPAPNDDRYDSGDLNQLLPVWRRWLIAISTASTSSSAGISGRIDQPTILRLKQSSTDAR